MKRNKKLISIIGIIILVLLTWAGERYVATDSGQGNLEVHFIDVGQGDSILIREEDESILIDGGKRSDATTVVDYLKNQDIEEIKYLIGTHPHEDHIGGLRKVVDNFQVKNIIMPDISHNTKTFEDLLDSIMNKGLSITIGKSGDIYNLKEAELLFLAPNSKEYSNVNDYSIVSKLEYGNTSFLLTGDAEKESEKEMVENHLDKLRSDVLKLGHHGSNTSTTEEFLDAVNPSIGIITVGKDNTYGHPSEEVINRLEDMNVQIMRTDLDGNIIIKSDKLNIILEDGSSVNGIVDSILREISRVKNKLIDNLLEDI